MNANTPEAEQAAPEVFVSYSHDNPDHKRWVGELAARLVKAGVNVTIDQWDTGPGDDLPKFMEKAVSGAGRVLVICSDAYVQKADDGTGGAGYEAMIVTGELVKNLTMNKFIPIIRQSHGNTNKPKFLETKFHIDFSDDSRFEERLDELLREIHKAPKIPKPKLGKNPFVDQIPQSHNADPHKAQVDLQTATKRPQEATAAYFHGLELARNRDKVGWRKLLLKATSDISPALLEWKQTKGDKLPTKIDDLPAWALPGVTTLAPTIAIALAGVESGEDYFRKQIGLIGEFLRPANWELSGDTIITRFPEFVAFVYQALLGSVAMQTDQADIARRLATLDISGYPDSSESAPLYQSTKITGWPESMGHHCSIAWKFLLQLPDSWPWLAEIFGDAEHYKAALCAYYALLNVIEFKQAVAQNIDLSQPRAVSLSVPASFTVMGETISRRAKGILENNRQVFAEIWSTIKAPAEVKCDKWKQWEAVMGSWVGEVYGHSHWLPFHSTFIKSL